ncbi:adenosylmethionine--8-amino-7-oxononanoate transaminase [Daejeonella oryzae]|uniref:adenosylmethionine--8-amino-7-oxononanoate transaminase n=1 Tax=Daejeonella oryzae TaxID=1122943 RepID=UPI00047C406A|nr:adenosylmethionine--8-amino-7-oxononanoate transaminase [Daejeonella oryzae]
MRLSERDQQVIWHPYTQAQLSGAPIAIVRGEGVNLFDDTGNKYLDAVSSWWVNLHGHSHPYMSQKISEQLHTLEHVIFAGFTHQPAIELAERLLSILPSNQNRVFYSDNGSTATEVAIKMAIQYWWNKGITKTKIIAFEHAYHGDTFGAMSASARGSFTDAFSELLFEVIHIPLPLKGHENLTISILQKEISESGNTIAAFIFEPLVLGAGGMLMYEAEVLDQLLEICSENSILAIADEVMTGFGRTGKNFACGHLTRKPDIICLSKGITGGTMAFGATTCTAEIYAAFLSDDRSKTFFHGHSYTANPVACSAALASFDLLIKEECQQNIQRIASSHVDFVTRNQGHKILKNLRSTGTILAMDIETVEQNSYFHSLSTRLYTYFIDQGIILRPLGNTIYLMPPYCINDQELSRVYAAMESFI